MGKLCIKCGYERKDEEQAPDTECPRCGVIYARVEANAANARQDQQAQQARLATALRRRRESDERNSNAFLSFRWMLTPFLVRVTFVVALVGIGITFVTAVLQGNGWLAIAVLCSLILVRLLLESVMVLFRLSEDISEVRNLLDEQAIEAMRRDS